MRSKIEVRASHTQTEVLNGECVVSFEFYTIAEAKRRAKYYLTDEHQRNSEASQPLQYAQVVVDGECRHDFFRKGYKGEER